MGRSIARDAMSGFLNQIIIAIKEIGTAFMPIAANV
jgi:hypothetical protein